MFSPKRSAGLLQQFAQSVRVYIVVELSADTQIRSLLAFILAKSAGKVDRCIQSVTLDMFIDSGKILCVPSGKTGTPKTNHDFNLAVIRWHHLPLGLKPRFPVGTLWHG